MDPPAVYSKKMTSISDATLVPFLWGRTCVAPPQTIHENIDEKLITIQCSRSDYARGRMMQTASGKAEGERDEVLMPAGVRSRIGEGAKIEPVTVGCSAASVFRIVTVSARRGSGAGQVDPVQGETLYLKVDGADKIAAEAERMQWLGSRITAPNVFVHHEEGGEAKGKLATNHNTRGYMLTSELAGIPSFKVKREDYPHVIKTLARGLRALHQLPIAECPFSHRLAVRFQEAKSKLASSQQDSENVGLAQEVRELERNAPEEKDEDLVVLHGDYCLPNIIVNESDCELIGMLDLGRLGIGDRHHDIALVLGSLQYNFGDGPWKELFYESYGHENLSQAKIDFYRVLEDTLG